MSFPQQASGVRNRCGRGTLRTSFAFPESENFILLKVAKVAAKPCIKFEFETQALISLFLFPSGWIGAWTVDTSCLWGGGHQNWAGDCQ